jgi:hypothetical protein
MTRRERLERKADRLDGWAENREHRQAALDRAADPSEAATGIPFGQPILVGHHSERRHRNRIAKLDRDMAAAVDNSQTAQRMRGRADGIRAQLDGSIYDDDPDALDRLRDKLAGLEAKRERIKAYNKTCRTAARHGDEWGDLDLLTEAEANDLRTTARVASYQVGAGGKAPGYWLSNLGGQISGVRKRIARLERVAEHGERGRPMTARRAGDCRKCDRGIEPGQPILWYRIAGEAEHHGECPT